MARNKVTKYSLYTDLRGKTVELRNGATLYIPKYWVRITFGYDCIQYLCSGKANSYCWQNTVSHIFKSPRDIMKVIK